MISLLDFFTDLTNPALIFLPKTLLIACLSSIVCGVVGVHVVLRGMAFVGDALAHAVFPGLAIAFALQTSLLLGGAVAGVAVALLITVFSQNRVLKEDSLIGIFFAAAFALGLVIISKVKGYSGSLESFLFGSISAVPNSDLLLVTIVGCVVILSLAVMNRYLVTASLDRESARAQHLPLLWLDLYLYLVVTAAVIISVRTIGNILVLALLVTPGATARLLTDRLTTMMLLGPVIGFVSAFFGIYGSWALDIPTGGAIVLVVTFCFLLAWLFSPTQGVIGKVLVRMRSRSTHSKSKTVITTQVTTQS